VSCSSFFTSHAILHVFYLRLVPILPHRTCTLLTRFCHISNQSDQRDTRGEGHPPENVRHPCAPEGTATGENALGRTPSAGPQHHLVVHIIAAVTSVAFPTTVQLHGLQVAIAATGNSPPRIARHNYILLQQRRLHRPFTLLLPLQLTARVRHA
jgi:hypothetical protein